MLSSRQPWRLSCAKFSPSLSLHQFWPSPTRTPWPTGPAPSTCTATRASMVLGLRLNMSSQTAQYSPSLTSATLPSILRGAGLRLTWKLAALPRPSNAFKATFRARSFASSRITRRSKASTKREITMLAVDLVSHRVPLHPRVPQRQRQRKGRFPVPFARACHGTRPHCT